MTRSLVLLRGINVSGHNKVPMADLRTALGAAGLLNVATYIQSGNIGVDSNGGPEDLAQTVEGVLAESFDVHVPAVVVTQSDIQTILDGAPFAPEADPAYQLVYFASDAVDIEGVAGIDRSRYGGDEITAARRAIYVSYENGQGKSKLTVDALERAAGCTLTGRNLRSTAKLLTL